MWAFSSQHSPLTGQHRHVVLKDSKGISSIACSSMQADMPNTPKCGEPDNPDRKSQIEGVQIADAQIAGAQNHTAMLKPQTLGQNELSGLKADA